MLIISTLAACKSKKEISETIPPPPPPPPAKMEAPKAQMPEAPKPAWTGNYSGELPCIDCKSALTSIELKADNTYKIKVTYLGSKRAPFEEVGAIKWDDQNDNIITLTAKVDRPSHFQIQGNSLLQLGKNKEVIEGPLTDKYRLYKKIKGFEYEGVRWNVVQLFGDKVKGEEGRIPHIIIQNGKFKGNGGCNSMFGIFSKDKTGRVQFKDIASTEMWCETGNFDEQLIQALGDTETIIMINENQMNLQTGKRSPHAILYRAKESNE